MCSGNIPAEGVWGAPRALLSFPAGPGRCGPCKPAAGASRKQRGEAVLALAGRGQSVSCALRWACSASLVCIQWIFFLAPHQSTACLEVEETNLLTIVRRRRGREGSRQIESRGKSPASPERGLGPGPAFASSSGPKPSSLQVLLLQEAFQPFSSS